ncbi:MAG: hypothetical protein N2648_02995 [Aquificaceae bacterium]|nr:hypothetical protein [Aquificaceae bacterium]MCS7196154.1 hypothetical protein [Aquificaceae bacterium]MCX7989592.1 hypothetical protein [Aquificaceae bacterium]MDW8032072.1 hypothetical protein [Aquificaceae bacterium]MDW8294728.1 hypothetical protein [Aquificaceae bacterium]
MEKLELYRKRAKELYYAFLLSLNLAFFASLLLYPYFKLPVHPNLVYFTFLFVLLTGFISLPSAYLIRKRFFPLSSSTEPYWSYRATKVYFWVFVLCLLPFSFSLLFFVFIARLEALFLGYILGLCGLILVRPREEDLK